MMILQENHKEFTVKCFAKYMTHSDVAHAFMQEFEHDLPKPPPPPEPPNYDEEIAGVEYQLSRNEYVKNKLHEIKTLYVKTYGIDSHINLKKEEADYTEKCKLDFDKEWKKEREKMYEEHLSEYQLILENHYMQIHKELSNQLRRLNITHKKFPEKYRKLFNESRDAFLKSKRDNNITNVGLTHDDNIQEELETIYGHVKNLVFSEKEPKEVLKHVNTAHAILKTISSYNKLERKDTSKELQNTEENNHTQ